MKPLRSFACFSLLILAANSHAQSTAAPAPDPKFFKDFTGVTALLRANGVEPSRLQWNAIENACAAYNDHHDPLPYNQCRFEKGRDQGWSEADARSCNDQAAGQYPDALTGAYDTNVVRYRNGNYSTTTIQQQPMTQSELNAARNGFYDKCMDAKGWRDPHNYLMGRSS